MKKNTGMRVVLAALLALAGFLAVSPARAAAPVVIKIGSTVADDSNYGIGILRLAALIKERTNGRYIIEHASLSQLGGERDMCEGVQMGIIGGVATSATVLANFVPTLNVLELPYLFRDQEHVDKVILGDIGKQFIKDIDDKGFKCIGIWESGFRQLCNNKRPITSVADVAGLKVRTMENAMHQELWRALDGDAVTMSWTDGYASVQQGAVDGLEVPANLALTLNVFDVCKYFAETSHIYTAAPVLLSLRVWDAMSPEDQKIFEDTAAEVVVYQREKVRIYDAECMKKMAEKGMRVTKPDTRPFAEKCQKVIDKYAANPQYGAVVKRILALKR